jgi:TetR/AcrR family transcriptional regulator, cholesterol catabolism regulator
VHACLDWFRVTGPEPADKVATHVADLGCAVALSARHTPDPEVAVAAGGRAIGARAPRSRRDEIDDAALRIVRAKGFAATTIKDVATEVGVLKGSVYHYVASKDELLMRIFEAAHLELTSIVGTVAQLDASPAEQLSELVRLEVDWLLGNPDQAVVLFREWPFLTGANRELVAHRRRALERFAARLFDQALAAGEISSPAGGGATVRFVLGAANAVGDWYDPTGAWSPAHVARGYSDLTTGLLRPDRTP